TICKCKDVCGYLTAGAWTHGRLFIGCGCVDSLAETGSKARSVRRRRAGGSTVAPGDQCGSGLVLVAQPVEALLHLFHLSLEIVDAGAADGRLRGFIGLACGLALAARKRREHREGALEHFHVPPRLFFQRAERGAAEGLRHLLAKLLLLAGKRLDRHFE